MSIGLISTLGTLPSQGVPPASALPNGQVEAYLATSPVAPSPQDAAVASNQAANATNTVDPHALQQSVETINSYLNSFGSNSVQFSLDSTTGRVVVQVVDTQTNTVLMQTPSKQTLAIAQALDKSQGLLIKTQA